MSKTFLLLNWFRRYPRKTHISKTGRCIFLLLTVIVTQCCFIVVQTWNKEDKAKMNIEMKDFLNDSTELRVTFCNLKVIFLKYMVENLKEVVWLMYKNPKKRHLYQESVLIIGKLLQAAQTTIPGVAL